MTPEDGSRPAGGAGRYDPFSIVLHWLLAILVLALIPLGLVVARLPFPGEAYDRWHMWHRSLGEIAFVVVLVWLGWSRRRPPPPPLRDDRPWRAALARAVHGAMIALLVVLPVSKLVRGAFGVGWEFFGLTLAAPWPRNAAVSAPLGRLHDWSGYLLIALTLLHLAAALWRTLALRDGTLRRILPSRPEPGRS